MTGDLAVWLRAQLDADEQTARAADEDGRWAVSVGEYETEVLVGLRPNLPVPPDPLTGMWGQVCCWHHDEMAQCGLRPSDILPTAEHIARYDPAFTLADITAKKKLLAMYAAHDHSADADHRWSGFAGGYATATDQMIEALAQPYAGRPGWRDEWSA